MIYCNRSTVTDDRQCLLKRFVDVFVYIRKFSTFSDQPRIDTCECTVVSSICEAVRFGIWNGFRKGAKVMHFQLRRGPDYCISSIIG